MSMLPRLKPKTFYDLVIEVAIVHPGPIQGEMVHPFQEQVIKLAMVAAEFSAGEADQLRRAMASWGHNGNLNPTPPACGHPP
jgi:error-prone DNA polymerase